MNSMLTILEQLPESLLQQSANSLHQVLNGPTLIHLPGRQPRPLFVSVLLHGNEDTGWEAVRSLLLKYADKTLPRAMSLFIGNVDAARNGMRRLDGQPDYNRVWQGEGTAEHVMMQRLVSEMAARDLFASIDVHNNTGLNPHYACVNRLEQKFFHLATLFSRTVVYFTKPEGVQSMAFAELCPAVTVECGKPGQQYGVEHARDFIDAALHLTEFPRHAVASHDYDLFHTVAIVKVPDEVRFGFENAGFDSSSREINFRADLDRLNFRELPAGTSFGTIKDGMFPLQAWDEQGDDVAKNYFIIQDGELCLRQAVMPSMLTLDERVVRQDCLCYLMERMPAGDPLSVENAD